MRERVVRPWKEEEGRAKKKEKEEKRKNKRRTKRELGGDYWRKRIGFGRSMAKRLCNAILSGREILSPIPFHNRNVL